jgi:methylase of polypeptide subunit release factors
MRELAEPGGGSMLARERGGWWRRAAGGCLRAYYLASGKHRYDAHRLERVQGMPLVVLPSVANPKLLRTGAFFASRLSAQTVGAGARVLDLGTGSGICALFAARHAAHVVGVDINADAVRCARANAVLNALEHRIDFRHGDLFTPVADERFDLVLFNPPFMLGTPRTPREAAWRSNDLARRFAAQLADHLLPGGAALLMLSSFGDACALFELELRRQGFMLGVEAERHFVNEALTLVRVRAATP